jgi:hypothetical protein
MPELRCCAAVCGESGNGPVSGSSATWWPPSKPASTPELPGPGTPALMAVNIWSALHGIIFLRTSRPPHHPWPPVETLVEPGLAGQAGLDHAT